MNQFNLAQNLKNPLFSEVISKSLNIYLFIKFTFLNFSVFQQFYQDKISHAICGIPYENLTPQILTDSSHLKNKNGC